MGTRFLHTGRCSRKWSEVELRITSVTASGQEPLIRFVDGLKV